MLNLFEVRVDCSIALLSIAELAKEASDGKRLRFFTNFEDRCEVATVDQREASGVKDCSGLAKVLVNEGNAWVLECLSKRGGIRPFVPHFIPRRPRIRDPTPLVCSHHS
jgi:hypothetical protein